MNPNCSQACFKHCFVIIKTFRVCSFNQFWSNTPNSAKPNLPSPPHHHPQSLGICSCLVGEGAPDAYKQPCQGSLSQVALEPVYSPIEV